MADDIQSLTHAEGQLLEFVRLAHARQYSVTLSSVAGVHTVKVVNVDTSEIVEAQGATFDEAWAAAMRVRSGRLSFIKGGRDDGDSH